jgi:multicomponent Na+:H+ antiporter subunit D
VLFFIGALNLGGIPPFSGFLGKIALFQAGVQLDDPLTWVLIAGGAATSLLTLYALARAWNIAFWRSSEEAVSYESVVLDRLVDDPDDQGHVVTQSISPLMVSATSALLVLTLALTVFAGPLFELTMRAAEDIISPASYIGAVFPGGAP